MTVAVRYFSKIGNTKKVAEAIAEGAGVEAVSIVSEPLLKDHVDVLFLGGAPYANVMDPQLKAYAEALSPELVGRVALFTTSNWSRRTVMALKKILKDKGIEVNEKYLYVHMLKVNDRLDLARSYGRRMSRR